MVGVEVQNYLNPMTLEAELFAKSLQNLTKTAAFIDKNLINALDKVVRCIENFLDQDNQEIVPTDTCHLLDATDLQCMSTIYFCNKCKLQVGNSSKSATKHITDNCCKTTKENKQIVAENLFLPRRARCLLTGGFKQFVEDHIQIADRLKSIPEYDMIEAALLFTIRPLFQDPRLKVYHFGSRFSGIGSRNSDVDFFIDIGDTFKKFENQPSEKTLQKLQTIYNALSKNTKVWKNIVKIEKARVPILKVYHVASGLECDIGFSNSLGVINTKLMEHLFEIQPIARVMCIVLKKWLERAKLKAEFTTYTIALMVIFFLQIRNLMPDVEYLQCKLDFNNALHIGPWLGSFVSCNMDELQLKKISMNDQMCKEFLRDFFEYYSNFDFKTYIVCPYVGKPLNIKDLDKQMPTWYNFYVKQSPDDLKLNINRPMVVQDPIQLNHNVAKGISNYHVSALIQYMKLSAEVLRR